MDLIKCIEFMRFSDFESEGEWMKSVPDYLKIDLEELDNRIKSMNILRPTVWSEELGSSVFSR